MVSFPARQSAILDLILSERTGTTTQLPNLNTSDHAAIFLSLAVSSHFSTTTPPPRRVFHWKHAPLNKLSHYFDSINWNFQGSTDDVITQFSNAIYSATLKFIPSHFPRGLRPIPWWNCFCEAAWQHKVSCWRANDTLGFTQASVAAHSIYNQAIQDYRNKIQGELQQHSTSKRWWSLIKSLTGSSSHSRPATPPVSQLAGYFSSKLSHPADSLPIPLLTDSHISLFSQFQIKISHVRCVIDFLKYHQIYRGMIM